MTTATRRRDGTKRFAPSTVVAGGLVWTAEVDNQPYSSWIGYALAAEVGIPDKLRRRPLGTTASTDASS